MDPGDPGLWGSYFVRMLGSAGGSEEVMLAARFLGCIWNRPSHDKRTSTDQKWMALFLCPSLRIFCVVVTFALLFASHYVVRSWRDKIFWPQILWRPEAKSPNMLSWQKDFSKRKERKVRSWGKGAPGYYGTSPFLKSFSETLIEIPRLPCFPNIVFKIPRDVWKPRLELVI